MSTRIREMASKNKLTGWRLWAFEAGAIAFLLIPGSTVLLLLGTAATLFFSQDR